jgi:GTP-binding protein
MTPRELSARRTALARACGHPVFVVSGVAGDGVPEVLREIQTAVEAARARAKDTVP